MFFVFSRLWMIIVMVSGGLLAYQVLSIFDYILWLFCHVEFEYYFSMFGFWGLFASLVDFMIFFIRNVTFYNNDDFLNF